MSINGKTQSSDYTVKYLLRAEKGKLKRELLMQSVGYFTGVPPPKQYGLLYLQAAAFYVPSSTHRVKKIYLLNCKTNSHDTKRVLPRK